MLFLRDYDVQVDVNGLISIYSIIYYIIFTTIEISLLADIT